MKDQIVTMRYRIYKEHYPKADTIPDSYSSRDKTIDVVLDEKQAEDYHMNIEEIEVEVPYWRYKKELEGYYYKKDSYNKQRKTVMVYMTIAEAMARGLI